MNIENLTSKINIGDAYKISSGEISVYGRIVGFDETSACFNGEYAVVKFATPGGTVIRTGRGYLNKIDTDEDLDQLEKYEELAKARGETLYNGLI